LTLLDRPLDAQPPGPPSLVLDEHALCAIPCAAITTPAGATVYPDGCAPLVGAPPSADSSSTAELMASSSSSTSTAAAATAATAAAAAAASADLVSSTGAAGASSAAPAAAAAAAAPASAGSSSAGPDVSAFSSSSTGAPAFEAIYPDSDPEADEGAASRTTAGASDPSVDGVAAPSVWPLALVGALVGAIALAGVVAACYHRRRAAWQLVDSRGYDGSDKAAFDAVAAAADEL
jgi:cobalamin biosynthesis Mg chelatase CobN